MLPLTINKHLDIIIPIIQLFQFSLNTEVYNKFWSEPTEGKKGWASLSVKSIILSSSFMTPLMGLLYIQGCTTHTREMMDSFGVSRSSTRLYSYLSTDDGTALQKFISYLYKEYSWNSNSN